MTDLGYGALQGMRVAPDGTITYDFDGRVHAAGLDLDAAQSDTPDDSQRVRWLSAIDGALIAEMWARDPESGPINRGLEATYHMPSGGTGLIHLNVDDPDADNRGSVALTLSGNSGPNPSSNATVATFGHSATLLDQDGASSFLQPGFACRPLSGLLKAATGTIAAGGSVNLDFAGIPLTADWFVLGSIRNTNGAEQLEWAYGPQGTGVRVVVRNLGAAPASGTFYGFVIGIP